MVGNESSSKSNGTLVGGIMLLGLGSIFLVAQVVGGTFWASFWPFLMIAAGGFFFVGMLAGGRGAGGLAIPGSILTTVGLLLVLQVNYGLWHTWSYAWTLIIIAVGVGIFIKGLWNEEEQARHAGLNLMSIGVLLLLVFGAVFEFGFGFLGMAERSRLVAPLVLIGLGIFLVLRASGLLGARTKRQAGASPEPPADLAR